MSYTDVRVPGRGSPMKLLEAPPGADCAISTPSTPLLDITVASGISDVSTAVASPVIISKSEPTVADPTLQDFSFIKELGAGAFGTVYLARHKQSGIRVALKAIPKVPQSKNATDWTPEKLEERLGRGLKLSRASRVLRDSALHEVKALLRVRHLKRILHIFASFQDIGRYYIATVSILPFVPISTSASCVYSGIYLWWGFGITIGLLWGLPSQSCAVLCC